MTAQIVAVGVCAGCGERKLLVAHGAACVECVAAVEERFAEDEDVEVLASVSGVGPTEASFGR